MSAEQIPTLAGIRAVSADLAKFDVVRFDATLRAAVADMGQPCDLTDADNARRLRVWLNQWLCRIRYPREGETDHFVDSLAEWWSVFQDKLPPVKRPLSKMSNLELDALADAYSDLVVLPARLRGGKPAAFGPTATAKVIFYERPLGVTAWDLKMSRHTDGDFRRHLDACRGWAKAIVTEAMAEGIVEKDIGSSMERTESSLAKLLDEFRYQKVTRGK